MWICVFLHNANFVRTHRTLKQHFSRGIFCCAKDKDCIAFNHHHSKKPPSSLLLFCCKFAHQHLPSASIPQKIKNISRVLSLICNVVEGKFHYLHSNQLHHHFEFHFGHLSLHLFVFVTPFLPLSKDKGSAPKIWPKALCVLLATSFLFVDLMHDALC